MRVALCTPLGVVIPATVLLTDAESRTAFGGDLQHTCLEVGIEE
jgi:hypothetical protein